LSKIISIGTAVPQYCHQQDDILRFMQTVYAGSEADNRKMRFLYRQSGIDRRYSVIGDYSRPVGEWKFYPPTENLEPFPGIEQRMAVYLRQAPLLSVDAIRNCLGGDNKPQSITHLITVSCTGISAPGLDLQVMELLDLPPQTWRTSVNFMGCYAAIHGLKLADAICRSDKKARVMVVCTELCTLHFQREGTMDNITSSMLFGDGSAAVLVSGDDDAEGVRLRSFYSEIIPAGKRGMAWEVSASGFLMTLSGYIPELIEQDFSAIVERAARGENLEPSDIRHWCIHPGGKRILEAIEKSLSLVDGELRPSYDVLQQYGNLSSATLLFVLKKILDSGVRSGPLMAAAFGPGLTVETFIADT